MCIREIISGTILNSFFFFLLSNYIHPLRSSISKSSDDQRGGKFAREGIISGIFRLFFAIPSSFLKSVLLSWIESSGIFNPAVLCVCVCSIDFWFINGISLGSWFVTAVVASFSLVITRYCRAKSN